jgi:hypothetical protein
MTVEQFRVRFPRALERLPQGTVGSGQEFDGIHYVHRFVERTLDLQHYRSAPFMLRSCLCVFCLIVLWIDRHDDILVANHDSF